MTFYRFYWFFLFAMVSRVTVFNRVRDADSYATIDLSALIEICLIGLAFLVLTVDKTLMYGLHEVKKGKMKYLFMYIFLSALSSFWSLNPIYTAYRSFQSIVISLVIVQIFTWGYKNKDTQFDVLNFFVALVLLYVSAVFINLGFVFDIKSFHTNDYSVVSGLGLICSFFMYRYTYSVVRYRCKKYIFFFSFFFLLGTSAASYLAMFFSILVYFFILIPRSMKAVFAPFILLVIISIIMADWDSILHFIFPSKSTEEIYNLRGRSALWEVYWEVFLTNPIFGNGYAVVARIAEDFGGRGATNAHNGFIEAALGTGIVGLFIFLTFFFDLLKKHSIESRGSYFLCVLLTCFIIINNNSKSIVGGVYDPTTISFLLSLYLAIRYGVHKKELRHG